jgi:hypothetical protein
MNRIDMRSAAITPMADVHYGAAGVFPRKSRAKTQRAQRKSKDQGFSLRLLREIGWASDFRILGEDRQASR